MLRLQGHGDRPVEILVFVPKKLVITMDGLVIAVVDEKCFVHVQVPILLGGRPVKLWQPVHSWNGHILKILIFKLVLLFLCLILKLQSVNINGLVNLSNILVPGDNTQSPTTLGALVAHQNVLPIPLTRNSSA